MHAPARALAALLILAALPAATLAAEPHKLAIHVDQNDPKVMNLALNNVANVASYYAGKGEEVTIEVVTYGPGLHMLRTDTSPVRARIASMALEIPNLTFSACENTRAAMAEAEGKEIPIVGEATPVPSGVVRLIELQEQDYSYVRP